MGLINCAQRFTGSNYLDVAIQVVKMTYTAGAMNGGQECVGECGQQGEDYWWCKKSIRFSTGKVTDPDWEYCSPDSTRTRYVTNITSMLVANPAC